MWMVVDADGERGWVVVVGDGTDAYKEKNKSKQKGKKRIKNLPVDLEHRWMWRW